MCELRMFNFAFNINNHPLVACLVESILIQLYRAYAIGKTPGCLGGKNVKEASSRLMKATVANPLADLYNYHGKKGKRSFGDLQLPLVMHSKYMYIQLGICKPVPIPESHAILYSRHFSAS